MSSFLSKSWPVFNQLAGPSAPLHLAKTQTRMLRSLQIFVTMTWQLPKLTVCKLPAKSLLTDSQQSSNRWEDKLSEVSALRYSTCPKHWWFSLRIHIALKFHVGPHFSWNLSLPFVTRLLPNFWPWEPLFNFSTLNVCSI